VWKKPDAPNSLLRGSFGRICSQRPRKIDGGMAAIQAKALPTRARGIFHDMGAWARQSFLPLDDLTLIVHRPHAPRLREMLGRSGIEFRERDPTLG
jgi:hypothetical protein